MFDRIIDPTEHLATSEDFQNSINSVPKEEGPISKRILSILVQLDNLRSLLIKLEDSLAPILEEVNPSPVTESQEPQKFHCLMEENLNDIETSLEDKLIRINDIIKRIQL